MKAPDVVKTKVKKDLFEALKYSSKEIKKLEAKAKDKYERLIEMIDKFQNEQDKVK